jgi:hypothetical protein
MLDHVQTHRGIRNIPDSEVRTGTYLGWSEWLIALDRWEGDKKHLPAIIAYLKENYGLSHYWATIVATYYLIERLSQ